MRSRYLENLWRLTKVHIQRENSNPLPSYICIAFTHPEITRRFCKDGEISAHVIGHCARALVVNKLAADLNSFTVPLAVNDAELACLSSILDSQSRDLTLCLTQPGIVELVNLASFAIGHLGYLKACDVPFDPPDVLQQTLDILIQALPAHENVEVQLDETDALSNTSDDRVERAVAFRFHGFLKICTPGASPLTEELRTSCLRVCLKTLWHSVKTYHQTVDLLPLMRARDPTSYPGPLPPYFPLMLASPEVIHHFKVEPDSFARLIGRCFGALVVSKLVDDLKSPVSLGGYDQNAELACISAILGTGHREDLLMPYQLRVINFRLVVSLVIGEIDNLFTETGMPGDMLNTVQLTLSFLADRLRDSRFIPWGLPLD
jgi:hypothetical protein